MLQYGQYWISFDPYGVVCLFVVLVCFVLSQLGGDFDTSCMFETLYAGTSLPTQCDECCVTRYEAQHVGTTTYDIKFGLRQILFRSCLERFQAHRKGTNTSQPIASFQPVVRSAPFLPSC